jgi:hypothetical protein
MNREHEKGEQERIVEAVDLLLQAEPANAPVISERELFRRVVAFANTGRPDGLPGARTLTVNGQTFWVVAPNVDPGKQHTELCKHLGEIVAGGLSATSTARLCAAATHVVVKSYHRERGKVIARDRHFVGDHIEKGIADVLLREGLAKDLKRCQLPGCGRYFLASDQPHEEGARGRRPYLYCSDPHRAEAKKSAGANRTARWRARRAK